MGLVQVEVVAVKVTCAPVAPGEAGLAVRVGTVHGGLGMNDVVLVSDPSALVVVTLKVYVVPLVRPVNVTEFAEPEISLTMFPGWTTTWELATGRWQVRASQLMVAPPLLGATYGDSIRCGGLGTELA